MYISYQFCLSGWTLTDKDYLKMWNWAVGRGQKTIEDSDNESLDCLEQTDNRIMEVNDSANKDSEGSEEHGRENLNHPREQLNHRLLVEI